MVHPLLLQLLQHLDVAVVAAAGAEMEQRWAGLREEQTVGTSEDWPLCTGLLQLLPAGQEQLHCSLLQQQQLLQLC